MVKFCAIKTCKNYEQYGSKISFHKLPTANDLREKWLAAIPTNLLQSNKIIYICSTHFTPDCFQLPVEGSIRRILKKTAVPNFNYSNIIENKEISNIEDGIGVQTGVNNIQDAQVQTSLTQTDFQKMSKLQVENRILKKRLNYREKGITSIKCFIKYMKDVNYRNEDLENVLMNNFNNFSLDLIRNELRNNKKCPRNRRYSVSIKQFALTLFFYSPRAYQFVRKKIILPHSRAIRRWLSDEN